MFKGKSYTKVLQKFRVAQSFSTCGNTVAPKLHVHVTEGIPSAHVKFCGNQLKITEMRIITMAATPTAVLMDE